MIEDIYVRWAFCVIAGVTIMAGSLAWWLWLISGDGTINVRYAGGNYFLQVDPRLVEVLFRFVLPAAVAAIGLVLAKVGWKHVDQSGSSDQAYGRVCVMEWHHYLLAILVGVLVFAPELIVPPLEATCAVVGQSTHTHVVECSDMK